MTATTLPAPARGRAARTLLRTESRLFLREPVGLVWGFAAPVAAFVVLGCIPAVRRANAGLGGASFLQAYQPVLIVLAVTMLGLTTLPQVLATYRERGVLRRLAVTPMPPSRLLAAQLLIHLGVALATALVVLVVGEVAFDVGPGAQSVGWLLAFVLTAVAVLGLGLLIAALAPSAKYAGAIGTITLFPLMFAAGLWIPRAAMAPLLRTICDWTPLGAANRAMGAAVTGRFPAWAALLALAAYGVLFGGLAVRTFRWQ